MCIRQINCEHGVLQRGSFSPSMRSCWKVTELECILAMQRKAAGSHRNEQPLGCEWACSSWSGTLGSSVQRAHGPCRDSFKQEFSASVVFLFLYLNLVTMYFYITRQTLSRRKTKAREKVVPGTAMCH